MKVLCNNLDPPLSPGSKKSNGWLTIGNEYVVISVYGRGDRLDYRIVGDDGFTPALQPASQFNVIDGAIPENWVFRQYSASEWVIMPATWATEGFWTSYFDGDASARAAFDKVISAIGATAMPRPMTVGTKPIDRGERALDDEASDDKNKDAKKDVETTQDKELDRELEDSMPASDPPSEVQPHGGDEKK